jgi:hypothetical protein
MVNSFRAELLKMKRSRIVWISFIAFAMAPLMGAVFMVMLQNPGLMSKSSAFSLKAEMMGMKATCVSYFSIIIQAMGVGGVLVMGFIASWIFGREYSDGTVKDLLALPTSRSSIIHSKFLIYVLWASALALSNLLTGAAIALALDLDKTGFDQFGFLSVYFTTTFLTILLGPPIAFFALLGKGFMAPLGFVALTLVFSQIVAAAGFGNYFPWSIPGLYSGAGGEYKDMLNIYSYVVLLTTAVAGYMATIAWWKFADQK